MRDFSLRIISQVVQFDRQVRMGKMLQGKLLEHLEDVLAFNLERVQDAGSMVAIEPPPSFSKELLEQSLLEIQPSGVCWIDSHLLARGDGTFGGPAAGEVSVLGAATGSGKTMTACILAVSRARYLEGLGLPGKVLLFSYEDDHLAVMNRCLTAATDVPKTVLDFGPRCEADNRELIAAMEWLNRRIAIIDMRTPPYAAYGETMAEGVEAVCKRFAQYPDQPIALVIIDSASAMADLALDASSSTGGQLSVASHAAAFAPSTAVHGSP